MTPEGEKRKRGAFYPVLVGATFFVLAGILVSEILTAGVPTTRLIPASQMIVQFDSFLTGGAMVAFSFFWGSLVRDYRSFRTQLLEWKQRLRGLPKERSEAVSLAEKAQLSERFLLTGIGGIISFALSALLAVGATITDEPTFLIFSLITLAFGVAAMFWSWFEFHRESEKVSDLVEIGRANLAWLDSGAPPPAPSSK